MGVDGGVVGEDTLGDEELGSGPKISGYDEELGSGDRKSVV